jgi:succinoglycan biosynthesis protein ExoO
MSSGALDRMAEADASFRRSLTSPAPSLVRALDRRLASIESAQAFSRAVDALKARRPLAAAAAVARRPKALLLFRMPLAAAFARIGRRKGRPRRTQPASSAGRICFISRQRLVGATNGSSTYLIDIARAARRAGLSPHLIQPSPVALGRWPVLRLRKDMEVFESIAFRGVIRAGRLIIARDPAIYLSALRGAAAKALSRLGAPSAWLNAKPAPYASAAPWTDQDRLFVAQHARGAEILVADYAWQTEGFACALTPGARTAIVMHDLFHRRAALFHQEDAADSVASLSRDEEVRLLARADAIFAIQGAEAAEVSRLLPGSDVVLVPMTAQPRQDPQPGSDGQLLFVGSNTAPNVLGLTWFFERIWPRVRQAASGAELLVAGNVSRALGPPPPGVVYLGVVDSLAPLYARAAVVISLLTTGSGLKIKLIEALAEGKACVVTPVTLQGVEQEVGAAVACEDQPDDFAAAVIALLADPAARTALGARALSAIQGGFSPQRAHADLTAWLARRPGRTAPELGRLEALPAA